MSQVNNRNASAGKRARTDGGRREDDWTCPSCGNVNFSFRTTCNMHNCSQSRPADHNTSGMKPLQAPVYAPSAGYMGGGAPSSMYLGGSSYGSPLLNGPSLSPYDMRYTGGSAYHVGYGGRSVGNPYGPLHMPGSPYSSGSMMGPGGMYGMPSLMDRYGLGLPMGHGAMGPRPGAFPEESSQKKAAGREDDWTCPTCSNLNFAFRTVCNMRNCNTPRPGSQGSNLENSKGSKPKMPEGSWKCQKCNNINYPFRTKCNRQNCGAEKPSEENTSHGLSDNEDNQAEYQRLRERTVASAPDAGEAGTSSQPTQASSADELWIAVAGGLRRGTYYGTGSYGALVATQSSRASPASVHGPQPSQESARVHQMMESLRDDLLRRIEEQPQHPTDDSALLARLDALDRGIMDLMETTERTERTVGGLERTVTELQTGQVTMAERLRLAQDSMVQSSDRMLSIMDSYHQRLTALERAGPPGAPSSSSTSSPPPPSSSTPTSLPAPSVSISLEEYELFLSLRRGGAPPAPDP